MELTLEQATENAAGFQAQLDRAKEELESSSLSSQQRRLSFRRMIDAKIMLEWYHGYEDKDSYGNVIHVKGLIQKLAGEAQRLKETSNLGARFSDRTFANFDPRKDSVAFIACRDYANNDNLFGSKRNSLIIYGGVGSGKTHLAAAIANVMIDRGIPVLFGTFSEHLEHIREEYDHTGQKKYLSMMKSTPMLVLDDLGKERKTDWTQQILFDVINYRYEHLLPTIVTSNLNFEEMGRYVGNAIFSRLYEMSGGVKTAGADHRRQS